MRKANGHRGKAAMGIKIADVEADSDENRDHTDAPLSANLPPWAIDYGLLLCIALSTFFT
jgi:hypothetical protein